MEENGGNLVFWEVGFSTAAISFSGSVFSGSNEQKFSRSKCFVLAIIWTEKIPVFKRK